MSGSEWRDRVEDLTAVLNLKARLAAEAPPQHPKMPPIVTVTELPSGGVGVFLDVTVLAVEGAEKACHHPLDGRVIQFLTNSFAFDEVPGETPEATAARMEKEFAAALAGMRAVSLTEGIAP